jgi:phosphoribosylformylglycinamidine synthase
LGEHCKHKIFTAKIDYADEEAGAARASTALLDLHQGQHQAIRQARARTTSAVRVQGQRGRHPLQRAADVCIKVETHNSPSALDPPAARSRASWA